MKKILFSLILFAALINTIHAQSNSLTKQETLDYILKLFKANYDDANNSIKSVALDGKIFTVTVMTGQQIRTDFNKIKPDLLKIVQEDRFFFIMDGGNTTANAQPVIFKIQLESDAIRLKKALAHLIKLVQAEKSTDPFDN
jgi:hypothetical protein